MKKKKEEGVDARLAQGGVEGAGTPATLLVKRARHNLGHPILKPRMA